jgi:hypothetical protein
VVMLVPHLNPGSVRRLPLAITQVGDLCAGLFPTTSSPEQSLSVAWLRSGELSRLLLRAARKLLRIIRRFMQSTKGVNSPA